MSKKKGADKPRCSGTMTEAAYITFIKNQLRGASWKWLPTSQVLKEARTRKGFYTCNSCKEEVPTTILHNGKRVKNVSIDHEPPIINPAVGWQSWDSFINNLYCEKDKLQLLCKNCHDQKSSAERGVAKETRNKKKELDEENI